MLLIFLTLLKDVKNYVLWSVVIDESADAKEAAQLVIFIKRVDKELKEINELLSLQCMKDLLQLVLLSFLKFSMLLVSLVWTYFLFAESQSIVLEQYAKIALEF